ncbi:MAG: 2-oxo acid dehydrogenase subunit E2 [Candidatus Kariarchaeaceae archaeon]|jgi:pyruvate/2-oxoglutarate dehydrogenase complex dihydrolipoamide acyltransferase (E2) component
MVSQNQNSPNSEESQQSTLGYREITRKSNRPIELLDNLAPKHRIYGMVEVDVTEARKFISDHEEKTGEKLSFTGWVINCVAQAISEHKEVQAYKKGKKKLIVFDDVDVGMIIERQVKSERFATAYCVRKANEKSFRLINDEIRRAQKGKISEESKEAEKPSLSMRIFSQMPNFFRKLYWRKIRNNPFLRKRLMGTVAVTAVGMFGKGGGWAIPIGLHSVVFALGGISTRPRNYADPSKLGEFLNMTVMFDEEVSLGAPATRFLTRLIELMQKGFGLDQRISYI